MTVRRGAALVVLLVLTVAGCGNGAAPAPPGGSDGSGKTEAATRDTPGERSGERSGETFGVEADSARAAASEVRDSRPTAVELPSGATVPVRAASTDRRGLLRVPRDVRFAGWWDGGARVGAAYGAIVVAGHVDSATQGLGPFAELLGVDRGDTVEVAAGRLRQPFVVTEVDLVPKTTLETRGDLFAAAGPPRLVLITCAGAYDPARGGYQDLAVVTALPSAPAHAR